VPELCPWAAARPFGDHRDSRCGSGRRRTASCVPWCSLRLALARQRSRGSARPFGGSRGETARRPPHVVHAFL